MEDFENTGQKRYTTRLQKGGALLGDMRLLVRSWEDGPVDHQREQGILTNVLGKATRARAADVYRRTFLPRFVHGPMANAWRFVRPLEDNESPIAIIRPIYFWISAKAEPLLYDFCIEMLFELRQRGLHSVTTDETAGWIRRRMPSWTPTVGLKVARGLLAALRDFGILEGTTRKTISPNSIPTAAICYIGFLLHQLGARAGQILHHGDWRLFLLSADDLERQFLEAHQQGLLEFQAAGSTIRITFPTEDFIEYARLISKRPY